MTDTEERDDVRIRLCELERRMDLRFTYEAEAVKNTRLDLERRLQVTNEWQRRFDEGFAGTLSKDVYGVQHGALQRMIENLAKEVDLLKLSKAAADGKTSTSNLLSFAALIVAILVVVIQLFGGK